MTAPASDRFEAVVFDFGGVIIDSPFEAFAALERQAGVAPGSIRALNARNPDGNAWARIERGEIDADTFVALFEREASAAGVELPAGDVLASVTRASSARHVARPVMLELLTELHERGLRLALITNNIRPLGDSGDVAWVFDTFDAVVESAVVGVRKPEPAIYRLALDALGVEPERAVMLDDLGINLKPARALGMATIKVVEADQAVADLRHLLGWSTG
ncbi:HAD-IA family hydrolase [uncultured Jatrophihabitans sp.]|uniref:HAD-IA family hydrolase n=1 Tax=uncultured Jatrophihabitans sp. TaxID=1610747 RepID=UPI0035C98250